MKVYRDKTRPNDYEWHEVYPEGLNPSGPGKEWMVTIKKLGWVEPFRVRVAECGLSVLETTEGIPFFSEDVDELRLYW